MTAMVLCQRRDLLVGEASRREQVVQAHSEDSTIQVGSLFMLGMMQVSDRIADSDIANWTNAPIEDPEFPLLVSLEDVRADVENLILYTRGLSQSPND